MSNQKRLSLRIIAQQTIDGWTVEVLKDGRTVLGDIPVKDPLSPDQRQTISWYLEKYLEYSPFSLDRAEEAELLLESYPEDLLRQLPLRELLASDFEDATTNLDSALLCIEVYHGSEEGRCSLNNIHRLFWETLENPKLWCHPRLAVVVERSVSSPQNDPPCKTGRLECWKQADGSLTLNVLLVVARNITQTPSKHDDISPFLATDVLINVQKMLADARSPVQINLEIVRPGTFASFVNHLERTRTIHGEHGYFHVVHFDMHGKIGTRKGNLKDYGFLYFSDPDSDGTKPVPGQLVGKILEKSQVPFAVLNACESAKACHSEDANIAQQFLKHGVRSVLGMSFKIASSAAAIFLETFYHALLVRGNSFSEAAAMGRTTLRMNPMRPARYNRRQRRQDSFVAVTYGPGLDFVLPESTYPWQRPLKNQMISLPAVIGAYPSSPATDGLYGRDLDLFRFEKRLLQTHFMYLHGLAGVGKSVFLDRAVSLWQSTNFVDAVIGFDFSKDPVLSGEDVSLTMLRKLLLQVHVPKYQSLFWTIPSCSLQSYNNAMVDATVAEILSEIESILIFDNLDIPLMPHPSHLAPSLNETAVLYLCQFINSLVALSQNPNNKKPRLVFAARRRDAQWLETLIGPQLRPVLYELEGLDLVSAIGLSHQVLQTCGEDIQRWSYEDADHLVNIVQLLACNPSAILGVLPLRRALKIEWRLFYQRLHHGLFSSVADLQQVDFGASRFPREIHHAFVNLRQGNFLFICLFALYWDEAASVAAIQSIFYETANASLRQDFPDPGHSELDEIWPLILLSFALDRSYVRIGDGGDCLHVHPLFTIVGRAYLSAFITTEDRKNLGTLFCSSLESLNSLFVQQKGGLGIGIANLLSIVDFCLTDVALQHWPLKLLLALSEPTLLNTLPLTTRSVPREQNFRLLKLLSSKFDEVEPKEQYMAFFVHGLLRVVLTLEDSSESWEGASEISLIGIRLLQSLDQQRFALNIEVYQSCMLLVQFLSSFHLENDTGRQKIWKALMPLRHECYERLTREGSQLSDLPQLSLLSARTYGIEDAQNPSIDLSSSYKFALAIALRLIEANKVEFPAATTPMVEICQQWAPEQSVNIDIGQLKRMLSFDDRNLQSNKAVNRKSESNRNKDLENFYEIGDWNQAVELHKRMAIEASNGCRFKEAEQHIESMQAILTKASASRKIFDALQDIKRVVQAKYEQFVCTLYQSELEEGCQIAKESLPKNALGAFELTHKSQVPRPIHQDVPHVAAAIK